MATGPEAKVRISADDSPLRQSLREMVTRMHSFGDDASKGVEKVNAPLALLRDRFIGIAAVLGGGALFGKAVEDTAAMTEKSIQLAKSLGTGVSTAQTWIAALDDVGASSEDLSKATRGLTQNLRSNEEGLNKMGLATRDANGHLRPMNDLMFDAIKLANRYADGTDREIAAGQLFGKGVSASSALLKLNTEAVQETASAMRELGMVVGQEDVEAYERYDAAMDRFQLTKQALMQTIGNALMPVLTKLGEWFNTVGPAAVTVIRGAVGGLVSVFWGLKNAVVIVWETINALVVTVAEPIRALAAALWKVLTGDFKGAQDELENWPSRIGDAWSRAGREMLASSRETRDRIADLFIDGPEAAAKGGGTKRAQTDSKQAGGKQAAGASSFMQYYEQMLAEEKRAQATLEAGREYSKEQELAFWRFLQGNLTMTSADRLAILRKTADLELGIARQARQQREQMDQVDLSGAEQLALAKVDAETSAARVAVELGHMTKAQLAGLEVQFEQQRFDIQMSALQERMRLIELDPNTSPAEMARIKNELLVLEQQHQQRRGELLAGAAKEKSGPGDMLADALGSQSTWQNLLNNMLHAFTNWRQAVGSIFASVGQIFMQKVVTEPAAAYAASLAKMLLVKLGFAAKEQATDVATSSAKVMTKGVETTAVVGANAAQAGSGAASAMASIPYVGPVLALAAMAAVFAAVSGLATKSARGGYDIPSGVNPVVQTHEEEMILPSPLANAVRRMAERDEAPSAGGSAYEPVPLPHHSIGDFVLLMRPHFLKMLNGARREFSYR